jgi:hypothetical protein
MTPLRPSDVSVEDATHCELNGQSLDPDTLGERLAALRHEFVKLTLRNAGATSHCELDFNIARDRVLSADSMSRFIRDCRELPSARAYWNGISEYLYGVMAKERAPDSGLKHEQYVERYLRASEELSGFDRPLAWSVRALIAFHFNHFEDAERWAPEGALRHTAGAFLGLLQGLPWHFEAAFSPAPGGAVEDLLTDQDTLQILADASHGLVDLKSRADDLVSHLERRANTTGYDQVKRTLLAGEALAAREEEGARAKARKLARELASKHDTSAWASALLERLAKQ